MSKAHIVIVNWNAGELLRQCVASIAAHGGDAVDKVVVVDNGSIDGSADLGDVGPSVRVDRTGANLGFGRATNRGAVGAAAPYLLFLNPDAALEEGTLQTAIHFMDQPENAGIGICGIRLVDERGHTQRHCARFPSARTFLGAATGLAALFPRLFPPLLMEDFDHLESRPVDHVIGAFYLVRRDLFERVGGFDERFFVYLEDLDLSLRIRQLGWSAHYLAEAVAFHKGGGTSDQVKALRTFYALRSRLLYAYKHFSRFQAHLVAGTTLLIEPMARMARAALRLSRAEAGESGKAIALLWRGFPAILAASRRRATDDPALR